MDRLRRIFIGFFLSIGLLSAAPDLDPNRFSGDIAVFDALDKEHPPEKGGVVFAGSSSIRMLNIPKVFPGLKALNRGFGGSDISDVNFYLEKCVLRYEPKLVIFYCGGNDLANQKTPEQVEKDFTEFRTRLFQRVPKAKLLVLAIRPSTSRVALRPKEKDMNQRFEKACKEDPKHMAYVAGTCDRYVDAEGKPNPAYEAADGLHMNDEGYKIWHELLTPFIQAVVGKK